MNQTIPTVKTAIEEMNFHHKIQEDQTVLKTQELLQKNNQLSK